MESTPDIIVIGAGHNALVSACYLARTGLDVLVVEQAPFIGGMTLTHALVPEAPNHLFNLCALDLIYLRVSGIAHDLHLDQYGYREINIDPPYAYIDADGGSLVVFRDIRRTAEDIARFSSADARAYLEMMDVLCAGFDMFLPLFTARAAYPEFSKLIKSAAVYLRQWRRCNEFFNLVTSSAAEVIHERFHHRYVRGMLAGLCGFVGPITADGTGINIMMMPAVHLYGVGRPVGGTGGLPKALHKFLDAHGGKVRTSAPVRQIIVRNNRAVGVELESGEIINARKAILAGCDPKTTLTRLLADDVFPAKMRVRAQSIPTNNFQCGPFKVDVALAGRLGLSRFKRHDGVDLRRSTLLMGTIDDLCKAFTDAAAGRLPSRFPFMASITNAPDPTMAPEGQDALYLYSAAMPLHPTVPWDTLRTEAGARMMAQAAEYYEGIESLAIGRHVAVPLDFFHHTNSSDSCILHVDANFFRAFGPLRPARGLANYRTPVDGLWLTGIGTHPGGGVGGESGRMAAKALLKNLGMKV